MTIIKSIKRAIITFYGQIRDKILIRVIAYRIIKKNKSNSTNISYKDDDGRWVL